LGVVLLYWSSAANLENNGLDLLFLVRGPRPPPTEVCVVALDDTSYYVLKLANPKTNKERWPRGLHAEQIRSLKREGARAVAFDVLFTDASADPEQDAAFAQAVEGSGNVVLGSSLEIIEDSLSRQAKLLAPYAPFAKAAAAVGDVNLPADTDGVIRSVWPAREGQPGLALAAYELATGDTARRSPEARQLDYYGPSRTIKTVSIYQALDPNQYLPPGFFNGKLVFVGSSMDVEPGLVRGDSFRTPFDGWHESPTFGVEVHATIAANLIEQREIKPLDHRSELAMLLVLPIPILFVRPLVGAVVFIGLEALLWITAYLAFAGDGTWMPLIIPAVVQLPLAYLVTLVRAYLMRRSTHC
jgi:adenylate cyclase